MLLFTLLTNDCAAIFHDNFWCLKFLLVLGMAIGSLWLPNDPVIDGYMTFARFVSIPFLAYKAVLIILVAYAINDRLVSNVN